MRSACVVGRRDLPVASSGKEQANQADGSVHARRGIRHRSPVSTDQDTNEETDMTIPKQTRTTTRGDPMTTLRKTALVAGVFYLITFISIPTLFLYSALKTDRNFIISSGSSTG